MCLSAFSPGRKKRLLKMRTGALWLISFFTVTAGHGGFLGSNDGTKTKRELSMDNKVAGQEYELLLQVTYENSQEKTELENLLKLLKAPSSCLQESVEITTVKATTYCSSLNRGLSCACEDSYTWFSPSCLDPQNCDLHTTGALPSCECRVNNLSQSDTFCERAQIWGSFKINERFTTDLYNSSSDVYYKNATSIKNQLTEVYKGAEGFESVEVTQFREGSIIAGFEVIGSSSTPELLSAIEQMSGQAEAALGQLFPVEDSSFVLFSTVLCNSVSFGFGSLNDECTLPCSSGYTGSITVRCQSSGWKILRDSCVLSQLEDLQKNFSVIASNATEADISSLVQNLSVIVEQSPSNTAGNLASVVSILGNVSSLSMAKNFTVSNFTLKDVLNISNNILNPSSIINWTILSQEQQDASSHFLETLENISILVPSSALPLDVSLEFINWKGIPVAVDLLENGYTYQIEMSAQTISSPIQGQLLIGPDQFQKPLTGTITSMATLTFGNILPLRQNGNAQVNGPVIATIIPNNSINEVFLTLSKIDSNLSQPHCVFWDFSHLQWDGAGCDLVNETADTVVCRCTHLTSFSMLMSRFVPSAIDSVVKWITYAGLGVSIGSLILGLIIEALFWKQIKKNRTSYLRHICTVNIALSLLIADVWFIVAATVDATTNPSAAICTAAVFMTHFFYLSLFFWMLMLGLLLAYRIILVFHHMSLTLMKAVGFSVGYGCPLIISAITIAVTQPSNSYTRQDVCWLNWSDGSKPLLAFVVPALTIVAVNLAVVLLVLSKLCRPTVGERLNRDEKTTAIRVGKSLLVLTFLLGITWGFGIGTMVANHVLAWHVLFSVSNAFQGFFIFCFGILLDTKLRQLLGHTLSPSSSWKQTSKQNFIDLAVKPKCLRNVNPLHSKGFYSFSHSGNSSDDITLTQFFSTE